MGGIVRIALAMAIVPTAVSAQEAYKAPLADYHRALVTLQSHAHGASVENVFEWGLRVRELLLRTDASGLTALEALPSDEYEDLKREYTGFTIGRDDFVFAAPQPDYFADLARHYGDAVDQAFFASYRKTRPDGIWPIWMKQQPDANSCTTFSADLVASYAGWIQFRDAYPHRYRAEVAETLSGIEDALVRSTCACGDQASVLNALEAFERAFPQTRAGDVVRQRIEELRENRSSIRFDCVTGSAHRVIR